MSLTVGGLNFLLVSEGGKADNISLVRSEESMNDVQKTQILNLREKGLGYGKIARELGISPNTVKSFCRRNCADTETEEHVSVSIGEVTRCENCGSDIRQNLKRKHKRFCCDKCRNAWWNSHLNLVKRKKVYDFICLRCGKSFHIYGDNRRKYCSHECYIAERFQGGAANE